MGARLWGNSIERGGLGGPRISSAVSSSFYGVFGGFRYGGEQQKALLKSNSGGGEEGVDVGGI